MLVNEITRKNQLFLDLLTTSEGSFKKEYELLKLLLNSVAQAGGRSRVMRSQGNVKSLNENFKKIINAQFPEEYDPGLIKLKTELTAWLDEINTLNQSLLNLINK
jgi:hypothetical protein